MFILLRVPLDKQIKIDKQKNCSAKTELWKLLKFSPVKKKEYAVIKKKDTFCTAIKKLIKKNFHHHKSTECL